MAGRRFSFDDDDESSFQPHTSQNPYADQYHSARGGSSSYQVSSGAAYIPPREPSVSPIAFENSPPSPPRYLSQAVHQERRADAYTPPSENDTSPPRTYNNYTDSSPSRLPAPMPPAHRDPHAVNVPIPPPHSHHRSSSSSQGGRHPAAALAAGTGAAAAAMAAVDTGYHGRTGSYTGSTGYHGRDGSDPFDDVSEGDALTARPHGGYPAYPVAASSDPFATPRMSRQNISSADSYEMRPPSSTKRTASFDPYGGRGWHENERDLGSINPHDLADDDDEGLTQPKGRTAAGAAGAAAAGGILGGVLGKRDQSGMYGEVPGGEPEKSTWLQKQAAGNKRWKWIVGSLIGAIVVLAIIGGIIGGVIVSKKSPSSSNSSNSNLLDANSPQVKALLNNKNLHKIFPGMDYTPQNAAQWPDCLSHKPLQNNVTMDVAVMSQLTPAIRLYGTDCNQTEMVLDAISRLNLNSSMKVWMGVYIMDNKTTNTRQLDQMWTLLDTYGADPFAGVIVGNEVLLNGAMSDTDLASTLNNVRSNMTSHGWNLTVSTSDAGVSFSEGKNPATTKATDIVMANVHPFFGGVAIAQAAGWTATYADSTDRVPGKETLIAETGWPAGGGNYCTNSTGGQTACASATAGAVASVDNVNKFLADWACEALANNTRYFMFEAFDEAWKAEYNKPGETWETQWGLFDENRNEKSGLTIPDCGGKTASH